MKSIVICSFLCLFFISMPGMVLGDDLDDGISTYTDDSIRKWDNLGKKDRNVTYIKMNAKSRALVQQKSGTGIQGSSGSGAGSANMNSVVMGAGSTVRGDIIIIDDSKGDKTLVSD